jgi:hypothetical protein
MTSPRLTSAQRLPEKAFLARFDLAGQPVTRASLLAHYGRRVTSNWPAPPRQIRDLRLNRDDLEPDELVALADAILEYRFNLALQPPIVTPEGKIAWRSNPTTDREWLWALNRHQWWPVLGLAYAQTGDERYADAFVTQMVDWATSNPPPARKDERSPTWRLMEVGLRMRVSWIPCFALFYRAPSFTHKAKLTMLRSIYDHARFLYLFKTQNNHLLRESNGLASVGVCFPEFKEAAHWRELALTRLDDALVEQFNRDGSHFEVSTGYQSMVIDEYQYAYDLLRANDLSLPKENLAARLEKMYHVMAYLMRPDGAFPYINDGYFYWGRDQLTRAGEGLGRDDLIFLGTGGRRGTPPTDTSFQFPDAGFYVMRSDWTGDARYLLFDAGPYGGFHGHEDKLSIEVMAFGQPFIVDSSSCTYHRADPFRAYFVSSQAHNTVLVDGKSQVRRWRGENRFPQVTAGNDAAWISRPDFDYAAASYADGYGAFSFKKPADAEITDDVIHSRRILFVRPDYWIIVDALQASTPHTYQVLFHTVPEMAARVKAGKEVALSAAPGAATLHLIPAEPQTVRLSCLTGRERPIQGWYSPASRHKTPATAVIYEQGPRASTVITTLLYPHPAGQSSHGVKFEPLEVTGGSGVAYVVTTGHGRDYLLFSDDNSLKRFGPFQSRANVAGVRVDRDDRLLTRFEGEVSKS